MSFTARDHTSACQGQKSPRRRRSISYDPPVGPRTTSARNPGRDNDARGQGARGTEPGSRPGETLDALVTVLDEVRLGHSGSRSELVARTGLSRAIVAQRVGELLERGLVVEGDPGPSTGGRPPRQLTFRADAGHLLVADLGATSIDVAVTTLDGRILGHHDEPADIAAGPEVAPGPGGRAVRPASNVDARPPRPTVGDRHRRAGTGRVPDGPPDLPGDHARLGWLRRPTALRRSLRRAGLAGQRRQHPRHGRMEVRHRRRPRQRDRGQARHRDRRRDHLRRTAPSRRAGVRGRRGPHPGLG